MTIADVLRDMKKERRMTTKDVVALSGVPEPTLEKIFSGATANPKVVTLYYIVHALGYTLDDIFERMKKADP